MELWSHFLPRYPSSLPNLISPVAFFPVLLLLLLLLLLLFSIGISRVAPLAHDREEVVTPIGVVTHQWDSIDIGSTRLILTVRHRPTDRC